MHSKQTLLALLLFIASATFAQKDNKIYTIVEQNPEFPGGDAALFKYLHEIKYAQALLRKIDACGTMTISFTIEKTGRVRFDSCVLGRDCSKCNEMKKNIQKMPRWKPGFQNGKAVRVSYKIPIHIRVE